MKFKRKQEGIKLNLGSAETRIDGYLSVDANRSCDPDVVAVFPDLPFAGECASEIVASHVLEHMSRLDGLAFLKECHRVMRDGAQMLVGVPDTRQIMQHYIDRDAKGRFMKMIPESRDWNFADLDVIGHMFLYSTVQSSHHLWSYDEDTLCRAIAQAGFGWVKNHPRREWFEVCMVAGKSEKRMPGFEKLHLRPSDATY